MQTPRNPVVAVYTRARTEHGTEAQAQACRQLAEQNGWEVAKTFDDRHYPSALDREQYRRLVEAIEASEVDIITAAEVTSLGRSTQELNALLDLCREHDVIVRTADGVLDTSTPQGRLSGRMAVAHAEYETESQAARSRHRDAE
jgi:DNA invertase Pin-like site-specific DNA recombinase